MSYTEFHPSLDSFDKELEEYQEVSTMDIKDVEREIKEHQQFINSHFQVIHIGD